MSERRAQSEGPDTPAARAVADDDACADLRARIAGLWERAIDALFAYDDIELQQNPEIEAEYALKVGRYRDARLRSELAMLKARRKLHLARSARAEGLALGVDTLALVVADEFASVTRQADARLARYMALIDMRRQAEPASSEEAAECSTLYRRFVAWLHPDLSLQRDERDPRLLAAARSAYAEGDLECLRDLAAHLPDGLPSVLPDPASSADELAALCNMLDALVGVLEGRVADLKRGYPYRYRDVLADPNWVAGYIYAGNAWIERCDELTMRYRRELRTVLADVADSQ